MVPAEVVDRVLRHWAALAPDAQAYTVFLLNPEPQDRSYAYSYGTDPEGCPGTTAPQACAMPCMTTSICFQCTAFPLARCLTG